MTPRSLIFRRVWLLKCYYCNCEHGCRQVRAIQKHISYVRRVIIDYYSQGHWIKLLSFLRDKLRGAGRFPVGLSETFYAAFSKNYQGRMCARGGRQQIPKQRFHPNTLKTRKCGKHSGRDAERCVGEIFRHKKLRHSACNRCSGETSRRGSITWASP